MCLCSELVQAECKVSLYQIGYTQHSASDGRVLEELAKNDLKQGVKEKRRQRTLKSTPAFFLLPVSSQAFGKSRDTK
jgi:hypothetical protein